MNSEEEFFDAETGEPACPLHLPTGARRRSNQPAVTCTCHLSSCSSAGLESDDSGEVSFKDALVFDSKKVTGGGRGGGDTQENGVWERR